MAFPASAGYGNLPNGSFSPTIFSQKVLKAFRKVSVVEDITNTEFVGEIANYGDTVRIMLEPDIIVTPYTRGQAVIPQDLIDNDISLIVDQANNMAFKVDDLEAKQSHISWEELASNRGAYKLKDAFDSSILGYMAGQSTTSFIGSTASPTQVNVTASPTFTPLGIMNRFKRQLDVLNVPTDNRFFVADPFFWELMGDENSKLIPVNVTGDSVSPLRNGRVTEGQIRGFTCYESNNLPVGGTGPTATSGANYGTILVGHMSSTTTASQLAKTETLRDPTSFADIVRGLHLFGRKVLRKEAISVGYWHM